MVERRIRLPRATGSVKRPMRRRRLDLVSLKKELIQDIIHFSGEAHLEQIYDEFGGWGEDMDDVLNGMSIAELMRVHRWLGLSPPRQTQGLIPDVGTQNKA